MKKIGIICFLVLFTVSCSTKVDEMLFKAKVMQAEDMRNSDLLVKLAISLNSEMVDEGKLVAVAAGRIPSFESFEKISQTFKGKSEITDELANSMRFFGNNFEKIKLFGIMSKFLVTENLVESMLYLNTKEGFDFALSTKGFDKIIASNLWRSKDLVNDAILQKYYEVEPEAVVYSLFRLKNKNIAKGQDLLKMKMEAKAYGALICDNPKLLLEDEDWQVRVMALNADDSLESATQLLKDTNILVRQTALEIFLKKGGKLKPEIEKLTPLEAEIILRYSKDNNLAMKIYEKEGIFKEISAPYLGKDEEDNIMNSNLPTNAKLKFLEKNYSKEEVLKYAMDVFMFKHDSHGLIYVLESKDNLLKKQVVDKAIELGGEFVSILTDYKDIREGYGLDKTEKKPLGYYLNVLNTIHNYSGFTIKTEKGDIFCKFYHEQAPLTCFNIVSLIKKGYYKDLYFHRVVPAFVAQDGDPTGTGSGGPGYSIKCEYNKLKYNEKGMVGMALSGKDTGGSQYFLTHLATPHLNHRYTIFAKMETGEAVLDSLEKYDKITELILNGNSTKH